eukprot:TRINITY_DN61165_c0_g1_i2.p2 TRINITY_DN61165_c0_g1~~TRINITY_DN61165_c0_g1_i2.p2  ORF type:complete len:102 (-),score=18.17 TRINITY_DN61165_c0_g1_i2:85-390(-)
MQNCNDNEEVDSVASSASSIVLFDSQDDIQQSEPELPTQVKLESPTTQVDLNVCPCGDKTSTQFRWISCELCGQWYHLGCAGYTRNPPRKEVFICEDCQQK